VRDTCPSHFILLDLITLITWVNSTSYEAPYYAVCSLLPHPVRSTCFPLKWFVNVVPKYFNFATFWKDLLDTIKFWIFPAFRWRNINIYFVFSPFSFYLYFSLWSLYFTQYISLSLPFCCEFTGVSSTPSAVTLCPKIVPISFTNEIAQNTAHFTVLSAIERSLWMLVSSVIFPPKY